MSGKKLQLKINFLDEWPKIAIKRKLSRWVAENYNYKKTF